MGKGIGRRLAACGCRMGRGRKTAPPIKEDHHGRQSPQHHASLAGPASQGPWRLHRTGHPKHPGEGRHPARLHARRGRGDPPVRTGRTGPLEDPHAAGPGRRARGEGRRRTHGLPARRTRHRDRHPPSMEGHRARPRARPRRHPGRTRRAQPGGPAARSRGMEQVQGQGPHGGRPAARLHRTPQLPLA